MVEPVFDPRATRGICQSVGAGGDGFHLPSEAPSPILCGHRPWSVCGAIQTTNPVSVGGHPASVRRSVRDSDFAW